MWSMCSCVITYRSSGLPPSSALIASTTGLKTESSPPFPLSTLPTSIRMFRVVPLSGKVTSTASPKRML